MKSSKVIMKVTDNKLCFFPPNSCNLTTKKSHTLQGTLQFQRKPSQYEETIIKISAKSRDWIHLYIDIDWLRNQVFVWLPEKGNSDASRIFLRGSFDFNV